MQQRSLDKMHKRLIRLCGVQFLQIVDGDYLVYPADEGRYFDVDARYVDTPAAKAPRNETCKLVKTVVLAYQWTTAIALDQRILILFL